MEWRFRSEYWRSVSLHDSFISGMRFEDDITLEFEEGFDVCAENPLNESGRHMYTGKAAVILKGGKTELAAVATESATRCRRPKATGGKLLSAEYSAYVESDSACLRDIETSIPAEKMSQEELSRLNLEVLDFELENNVAVISCYIHDNPKPWCEFRISCESAIFCWNELIRDSWFQK